MKEVRKAYYTLCRKYHPDHAGDENRHNFQEISSAYETLCDLVETDESRYKRRQKILELVSKYSHLTDLNFLNIVSDDVLEEIPESWIENMHKFHDTFFRRRCCSLKTEIDVFMDIEDLYLGGEKEIVVEVLQNDGNLISEKVVIPVSLGEIILEERGDFNEEFQMRETLSVTVFPRLRPDYFQVCSSNEGRQYLTYCVHLSIYDTIVGGYKVFHLPDARQIELHILPNFLNRMTTSREVPGAGFLRTGVECRDSLLLTFEIDLPEDLSTLSFLGSQLKEDAGLSSIDIYQDI